MRALRWILLTVALTPLKPAVEAKDDKAATKDYPAKIVGKWKGVRGWTVTKSVGYEFNKDGTFKITMAYGEGISKSDKKIPPSVRTRSEGRYQITGDKLILRPKKGESRTLRIRTLTAKTLTWIPKEGKTDELRRVSK